MQRQIIVNKVPGEKRIALLENSKLVEFSIVRDNENYYLNSIYKGKVKRVIKGMESAFVDFGGERTGFIYVRDLKKNISYEEYQKNIEDNGDSDETEDSETIVEYVKEGEDILVQVIKEPIGSKGARLTSHITLSGRFAVLMPSIAHVGVSKKIDDREKRDSLRELGRKVLEKGYGIILRTMAATAEIKTVEKEIVALIKQWHEIEASFKKEKSEKLIYQAHSPLLETIKNTYTEDLAEIVVDNTDDYNTVRNYLKNFVPEKADAVKLHELAYPIFDYFSIEADIEKCLKKKVWMRSGGFLYIEQTEALTVIDVNTGKFLGKDNLEKTVLKTNIEAVEEICFHIRLRNLAGIIIVDFIDMKHRGSRQKVVEALEKELLKDPAKTSVYHFTRLGLIQITRKRTTESNIQILTRNCPYCSGNGKIKSRETTCFEIMRDIQRQAKLYNKKRITVEAHTEIVNCLEIEMKSELETLSRELKTVVTLKSNKDFHLEKFTVSDSI